MNMPAPKLLIDQGLPRSAARLLRAIGWDAIHVGEIEMAMALDEEIIQRGRKEERIIVTLDADFHAILAREEALSPSVVRLRVQGLGAEDLAQLIRTVVELCFSDLAKGAVVTANTVHIKKRMLPLGSRNA